MRPPLANIGRAFGLNFVMSNWLATILAKTAHKRQAAGLANVWQAAGQTGHKRQAGWLAAVIGHDLGRQPDCP